VGLGHACRRAGVTLVTRCRLNVALYDPPAPREGSLDESIPGRLDALQDLHRPVASRARIYSQTHSQISLGGEAREIAEQEPGAHISRHNGFAGRETGRWLARLPALRRLRPPWRRVSARLMTRCTRSAR